MPHETIFVSLLRYAAKYERGTRKDRAFELDGAWGGPIIIPSPMIHMLSIVRCAPFSLSISHNSCLKHIAKDWCYVYSPGCEHLTSSHVAGARTVTPLSSPDRGFGGLLALRERQGPLALFASNTDIRRSLYHGTGADVVNWLANVLAVCIAVLSD